MFYYVPSEGPDAIPRNQKGRKFGTIKGIRKLHSDVTTPEQCKVLVRKRSRYCGECLYDNYDDCQNKELFDSVQEIILQREASAAVHLHMLLTLSTKVASLPLLQMRMILLIIAC